MYAIWAAKRNGGVREPEQKLALFAIAAVLVPCVVQLVDLAIRDLLLAQSQLDLVGRWLGPWHPLDRTCFRSRNVGLHQWIGRHLVPWLRPRLLPRVGH
jgi:hypothetical protein